MDRLPRHVGEPLRARKPRAERLRRPSSSQRRHRQHRAPDEEHGHRRGAGALLAGQQAARLFGAGRFQVHAQRAHVRSPRRSAQRAAAQTRRQRRPRRPRRRSRRRRRRRGRDRELLLVGERRHDLFQHRRPRDDAALLARRGDRPGEAAHRRQRHDHCRARRRDGALPDHVCRSEDAAGELQRRRAARRQRPLEVDAAHRPERVGQARRRARRRRGDHVEVERRNEGVRRSDQAGRLPGGQTLSADRRHSRRTGGRGHAQLQRRLQRAGLRRRRLHGAAPELSRSRRSTARSSRSKARATTSRKDSRTS